LRSEKLESSRPASSFRHDPFERSRQLDRVDAIVWEKLCVLKRPRLVRHEELPDFFTPVVAKRARAKVNLPIFGEFFHRRVTGRRGVVRDRGPRVSTPAARRHRFITRRRRRRRRASRGGVKPTRGSAMRRERRHHDDEGFVGGCGFGVGV